MQQKTMRLHRTGFNLSQEFSPIAISMMDLNGIHLYHNQMFSRQFGYAISELKGSFCTDLFADEMVIDDINQSIRYRAEWNGEVEIRVKDGSLVPVMFHLKPIQYRKKSPLFFMGAFPDISKQKKIEMELRKQHEYISTMHSISLGMFRRLELRDLLGAIIVRASRVTKIPNGFLYLYDKTDQVLDLKAACGNMEPYGGYKLKPGKGLAEKYFRQGNR
jgi:PAS domain S-box-containing protein